jgi:DNA mismatch repair protein MutS
MQVGSFYEVYSANEGLVDIKKIADMLNITLTRKNKNITEISESNCYMIGFPQHSLPKYVELLLKNNFTTVIVNQKSDDKGKISRYVEEIVSPGTTCDGYTSRSNYENFLVSIFLEEVVDWRSHKNMLNIGLSYIDVTTGKNYTAEFHSVHGDKYKALDELFRVLLSMSAREIFVSGQVKSESITFEWICQYLELQNSCVHNMMKNVHYDSDYIEKILEKAFFNKKKSMISMVEFLDLEKYPLALQSYIALLNFAYKHSELIIQKLQHPILLDDENNVKLSYNTAKQLNIVSTEYSQCCLLDILNNCKTSMGKRLFKEKLLRPCKNTDKLKQSYEKIASYQQGDMYENVRKCLEDVSDLERLTRRIMMKKLHPFEVQSILSSIDMCGKITDFLHDENIDKIKSCLHRVSQAFSCIDEKCANKNNMDNIQTMFFCKGFDNELDNVAEKCNGLHQDFVILVQSLNELCQGTFFKAEYNEKDGYDLTITVKRYETFLKDNKRKKVIFQGLALNIGDMTMKKVSSSSSACRISHPHIEACNTLLKQTQSDLSKMLTQMWLSFLEDLKEYEYDFMSVSNFLANVDVISCNAMNAVKYRYSRPRLGDPNQGKSFVKAKNIRHPIIERIEHNREYVCNDVVVGTDDHDGLLLYGINASGKSSLMKSIGLNVIMASAGMYVPCEEFVFCPYHSIYTRIPSGDNLFKGQSTFTNEIGELRKIIKYADKNSLVIGDELCSGTESISAMSIVAAGILELSQRHTSFLFATHLHDITSINAIQNVKNLQVYHLNVFYDERTNVLVYDRKLKKGQGETLYGLEVCKSLDLPQSFLKKADEIRRELLDMDDDLLNNKRTKYNVRKFKTGLCEVCCKQKVQDIHHIVEQQKADDKQFIDHRHKNHGSNLVGLCKTCHDKIHHGNLVVKGYKETSAGIVLDFYEK